MADKQFNLFNPTTVPSRSDLLLLWQTASNAVKRTQLQNILAGPTRTIAPIGYPGFADIYTDGVNDEIDVQTLNDQLTTSGKGMGRIYFVSGNYNFSNPVLLSPKISVCGDGITSQLNSVGNSTIFKFIDYPGVTQGVLYNSVENLRFWGNNGSGIAIDCGAYGQEFWIKNNWFHKWGIGSTCLLAGSTNKKFTIIGNNFGGSSFDDNNTNAIDKAIGLASTGDVQIIGNIFGQFNTCVSGNAEKTHILGNDFYSASGAYANPTAIILGTVTGGFQVAQIVGNTFSDVPYGITIGLNIVSGGVSIIGNFFRNIANNAIQLKGAYHTVIGNYLQNVAQTGLGNNAAAILLADGSQHNKILANSIWNSHTNMTYGIAILDVSSGNNSIELNSVTGAQLSPIRIGSSSNNRIRGNPGFITENTGSATIPSGSTSIVVNHGLSVTPSIKDISTIMGNNPTTPPGFIYITNITSTQFTINCQTNPGTSGLILGWRAVVI